MPYVLKEETKKAVRNIKFCKELKENIEARLDNGEELQIGEVKVDNEILQDSLVYFIHEPQFKRVLKYIDYSEVSFDDMNIAGHQLQEINANIDLQKVKSKTVAYSNMTGVDLSHTSFNDVCVKYANLTDTKSIINLHDLYQSSIEGTNLNGCYVIIDLNRLDEIKVNDETVLDKAIFLDANMCYGEEKYYQTIAPEVAKTLVKSKETN